jgi:hypothetical protein
MGIPATATASPSDPENLPQRRNNFPVANGGKAERVSDHPQHFRNTGKTCRSVAQREFIRNAPATPNSLFLLECCGVADQTAILGGGGPGVSMDGLC